MTKPIRPGGTQPLQPPHDWDEVRYGSIVGWSGFTPYKMCYRCYRVEYMDGRTRTEKEYLCRPETLGEFGERVRDVFVKAFEPFAEVFATAAKSFMKLLGPLERMNEDERLMKLHGSGNLTETGGYEDLGLWQSDMCASWLHDSCPPEISHQCDCACHGRKK